MRNSILSQQSLSFIDYINLNKAEVMQETCTQKWNKER